MCFLPLLAIFGASCTKSCTDFCQPCTQCMDSCCNSFSDAMSSCEMKYNQCLQKYCISETTKRKKAIARQERVAQIRELKQNQLSINSIKSKFTNIVLHSK